MSVAVRLAKRADAEAILAAHVAAIRGCFPAAYSADVVEAVAGNRTAADYLPAIDQGEMHVAVVDGKVVGFTRAVPGEVTGLYVHPDYQGQGVGTALLGVAEEVARRGGQRGIALRSALSAVTFYQRCGWVPLQKGEITLREGLQAGYVMMAKCLRDGEPAGES